jgi:hypothetical protein
MNTKRLIICTFSLLATLCLTIPSQAQLVGYWPMDGDLKDTSATKNDGINSTGKVQFSDEVPAGIKSSKALSLTNNATVNLPHKDGMLDTDNFTLSLWFNGQADSPGMWARVFSKTQRVEKNSVGLEIQRSAKTDELHYRIDTLKQFNQHGPIGKILDGKWHHVAFTSDGTTVMIYVDGKAKKLNVRADKTAPFATTTDLILGQSGIENQRFFTGMIDDVAIWKNALTAEQISDLQTGKVSPADIK